MKALCSLYTDSTGQGQGPAAISRCLAYDYGLNKKTGPV